MCEFDDDMGIAWGAPREWCFGRGAAGTMLVHLLLCEVILGARRNITLG